jgi:hypothetical protein
VTTLGFAVFLLATAYRAIADRIGRHRPITTPPQRVLSERAAP